MTGTSTARRSRFPLWAKTIAPSVLFFLVAGFLSSRQSAQRIVVELTADLISFEVAEGNPGGGLLLDPSTPMISLVASPFATASAEFLGLELGASCAARDQPTELPSEFKLQAGSLIHLPRVELSSKEPGTLERVRLAEGSSVTLWSSLSMEGFNLGVRSRGLGRIVSYWQGCVDLSWEECELVSPAGTVEDSVASGRLHQPGRQVEVTASNDLMGVVLGFTQVPKGSLVVGRPLLSAVGFDEQSELGPAVSVRSQVATLRFLAMEGIEPIKIEADSLLKLEPQGSLTLRKLEARSDGTLDVGLELLASAVREIRPSGTIDHLPSTLDRLLANTALLTILTVVGWLLPTSVCVLRLLTGRDQ